MKTSEIRIMTGLEPQAYLQEEMFRQMDSEACLAVVESHFHPDGIKCQDCGSSERYGGGKTPKGLPRYRCRECSSTYTAISYTPFSGTKLGPRKIVLFMWLLGLGVAPAEIGAAVGLSTDAVIFRMQQIQFYAELHHNR